MLREASIIHVQEWKDMIQQRHKIIQDAELRIQILRPRLDALTNQMSMMLQARVLQTLLRKRSHVMLKKLVKRWILNWSKILLQLDLIGRPKYNQLNQIHEPHTQTHVH